MDNFAIDNGYIFSWSLQFELEADQYTSYTAEIGEDIIHSFWTGDNIVSQSPDGDAIVYSSDDVISDYIYYTTIDDVGCTYTDSLFVEAIENPIEIILQDTFNYYEESNYLYSSTMGEEFPNVVEFTWSPADGILIPEGYEVEFLIPNDNEFYVVTASSSTLPGCSVTDTVITIFPQLVLQGTIFLDENLNGIFDNNELPLSGFPYSSENSLIDNFSNDNGQFTVYCLPGSNTVTIHVDPQLWIFTTQNTYTVVNNDGTVTGLLGNVGISPNTANPLITDVVGIAGNPIALCNQAITHELTVQNLGNTLPSGYVSYTFDEGCTLINSNPEADSVVGNTIYFTYQSLYYSSSQTFEVTMMMPENGLNANSLNFIMTTYVENTGDYDVVYLDENNLPLLCSFDPNDKRELNGTGENGIVSIHTPLDYLIRFQNTGTAAASDVVLIDFLPSLLDWQSFQIVSYSHPCEVSLNSTSGMLTVDFDNINLPDSSSDPDGSQGYFQFRIFLFPNAAPGEVIHNTASIYFDANPPIITNETANTIFECENVVVDTYFDNSGNLVIDGNVYDINWYLDEVLQADHDNAFEIEFSGNYYAEVTLPNGCDATTEVITVDGVDEVSVNTPILFPNPSDEIVFLRTELNSIVTVTNMLGQVVHRMNNVQGIKEVKVPEIQQGNYLVEVINESGRYTLNWIVLK